MLIVTPKNGIQGRTRGTKQKESQAKALESQTSCTWNSQKNLRNKPSYTSYEKEPQVSKVVNQPQVSSSSVLPPTPPVHSSSFHHVCCVVPFIGPKPFLESRPPSP